MDWVANSIAGESEIKTKNFPLLEFSLSNKSSTQYLFKTYSLMLIYN